MDRMPLKRITKELQINIIQKEELDINRFLIDWGLNMVGNPPSGNVLQTSAKEAQGPTKELFASMDQSDATRSAVGAGHIR